MADRRRTRVSYEEAEPSATGYAGDYDFERRYRDQYKWSEDRKSRDPRDGPREHPRDHRRTSWHDRSHRSWRERDDAYEGGRYRDGYERKERRWGDRREWRAPTRDSLNNNDRRGSWERREQSPDRARPVPRERTQETRRETSTTDTPSLDAMEDIDADQMAAVMGFGSFGTSKGKQVEDNAEGYAEIKKEHSWRQYMNRKGGFNRPLDKVQ